MRDQPERGEHVPPIGRPVVRIDVVDLEVGVLDQHAHVRSIQADGAELGLPAARVRRRPEVRDAAAVS